MPTKSLEAKHTIKLIQELDSEIDNFSRFDSTDKILAYACSSLSTYQSKQLDGVYSHMESIVPNTCNMLYTMPPSMSVT